MVLVSTGVIDTLWQFFFSTRATHKSQFLQRRACVNPEIKSGKTELEFHFNMPEFVKRTLILLKCNDGREMQEGPNP